MKQRGDFHVGDTFAGERTCDRYRPLYYAAVSGDFNPIHVDPELARAAGLPGNILQGMCTFGWMAEVCGRYLEDPARITRLEGRFARPVQVGDVVRFEGRCVAAEGARVRVEVIARNQRGEEVLSKAAVEAQVEEALPCP